MRFCNEHFNQIYNKNSKTQELIIAEYEKNNKPWFLGYSGGKDSSALLVLVFNALLSKHEYHKDITIVYCDTGVEIPPIADYVHSTLLSFKNEIVEHELPLNIKIVYPLLDDKYFVKVIGKGYPTPTNKFRWCTDKLRISPVQSVIDTSRESIVLLGVRKDESVERNRTISKHTTNNQYYLNQSTAKKTKIFSPIINYDLRDIWSTLMYNRIPSSINFVKIAELYKDAGTECPIYREEKGIPCGKGRFGCWTCTVIRKDKSVSAMIKNGYNELKPIFDFRNWLIEFRDNLEYRCKTRRNGINGLGPITLKGRKIILSKLLKTQSECNIQLIQSDEIRRIKELWLSDINNPNYNDN